MSVRQYIGARYVPRFSTINDGVWDNSYSYEALEIVKYGNDYYTSKKPVPTGVAITNTEYWVLTGNYNGAIGSLQDQINSLDTRVDTLEFLHERRFVFMGDSYDDIGSGWISPVCSILGITNFVDISYYGEGFTTTHSWEDRLTESTIANPGTVTDLVVCGGANDRANINAIVTAIANFKIAAKTKFTNLRNIYIGAIGFRCNTADYIRQSATVASRYKEACGINGLHYLHGVEHLLMYPTFWALTGDTNHPQPAGVQFMSRGIAEALLTGKVSVHYQYEEIIPFNGDWFTSSGSGISYKTTFVDGVCNTQIIVPTISVTNGNVSDRKMATNSNHFNFYAFPTDRMHTMYGFMGNDTWLPMALHSNANMTDVYCYTYMNGTGTVIPQSYKYSFSLDDVYF